MVGGTVHADYFNGYIYEVRIWDHELSALEIQSYYNTNLTGNESGLVGLWRFDSGSGTIISDISKKIKQ